MKERIPKRIRDPDRTCSRWPPTTSASAISKTRRIITQMRKKNPDRWADVRANLPRLSDPAGTSASSAATPTAAKTAQFVERVSQFAAILETSVPDASSRRTS
jgi:membrane-bound lytic murein transglycosylase F